MLAAASRRIGDKHKSFLGYRVKVAKNQLLRERDQIDFQAAHSSIAVKLPQRSVMHWELQERGVKLMNSLASLATSHATLCGDDSGDATDWNQGAGFGWRFGEVRKFFGVSLQIFKEALELVLHRVHLFAHVQNDF